MTMRTAIWVYFEREMPPRHLPGIGPESQVADAEAATVAALGLNGDTSVELAYGDMKLEDGTRSLGDYGVPPEGLLTGARRC